MTHREYLQIMSTIKARTIKTIWMLKKIPNTNRSKSPKINSQNKGASQFATPSAAVSLAVVPITYYFSTQLSLASHFSLLVQISSRRRKKINKRAAVTLCLLPCTSKRENIQANQWSAAHFIASFIPQLNSVTFPLLKHERFKKVFPFCCIIWLLFSSLSDFAPKNKWRRFEKNLSK